MLALVALTMAIIHYLPKLTKVIPAPLAGIGIVAAIVIVFGLDVPRVGDMASIEGDCRHSTFLWSHSRGKHCKLFCHIPSFWRQLV